MTEKRKFFYGWVIVGAGLCITMVMYGIIEVFGIMFKPLALECRWDRGTVSAAAFFNWIAFGASSLASGALSDRFGSQRVMLGGAVIFVAGTLLMSQVEQLWQLYLFFGVMLAVGRAATGVPLTVLVTHWFTRNQGLALSLSQSQNVGSVIFAPLAVMLIANYGWRGAYMWLGVGALVIVPLALLMRDAKPLPRQTVGPGVDAASEQRTGPQLTLREAMRNRVFWTVNFATLCCCITHSDILLHGANFMTDVGLDTATAAKVLATMALFGMIGKIGNGMLADRIGPKPALAGFLALQAIMVPFFLIAKEPPHFFFWAVLFGLGYGGPMPVYAMVFRQHFGTRSIGAILGAFFVLAAFGMGVGAWMGGVLHELTGSYTLPFLISASAGFVAVILVLTLPPSPTEPTARKGHRRDAPDLKIESMQPRPA